MKLFGFICYITKNHYYVWEEVGIKPKCLLCGDQSYEGSYADCDEWKRK